MYTRGSSWQKLLTDMNEPNNLNAEPWPCLSNPITFGHHGLAQHN